VLYRFKGGTTDGAFPYSSLIADSGGNLYGTTAAGGGPGCSGEGIVGCSTVFKLSPSGAATVLYSFSGSSDGAGPRGVIADNSGNLYGTTVYGGAAGGGTVFKFSPDGTETVLQSFCTLGYFCPDGLHPQSGLLADSGGNLYGMTQAGGSMECGLPTGDSGCGVVYRLSPPIPPGVEWIETVLYTFCSQANCIDGAGPFDGVIADSNGNLYGTAAYDGVPGTCEGPGCGHGVWEHPLHLLQLEARDRAAPQLFRAAIERHLGQPSRLFGSSEGACYRPGAYSATIPTGSFVKTGSTSEWGFDGPVNGVNAHARIWLTGTKQYLVLIKAMTALRGATNPVPVTLTLVPNSGSASVTAAIFN
jgi:uncharacterized repeat protein (TIGR03803 family)